MRAPAITALAERFHHRPLARLAAGDALLETLTADDALARDADSRRRACSKRSQATTRCSKRSQATTRLFETLTRDDAPLEALAT